MKEYWAVDDVSVLTFFFSREGIENLGDDGLRGLLEAEVLIRFVGDKQYCSGLPLKDDSENEMWSVNVVIGFEDEVFASDV